LAAVLASRRCDVAVVHFLGTRRHATSPFKAGGQPHWNQVSTVPSA
jgi:hypothetical protein